MYLVKLIVLAAVLAAVGACKSSDPEKKATATTQSGTPAIEVRNPQGETALLRAVNEGNVDEVRRLLDMGAQVDAPSDSGVTPLMNAAGMGNKEVVRMLLDKGADVNHKTPGNYTALMQSALVGQAEIVQILLDAGADPDVKDTGGRSASDYAREKDRKDIVAMLQAKESGKSGGKSKGQ